MPSYFISCYQYFGDNYFIIDEDAEEVALDYCLDLEEFKTKFYLFEEDEALFLAVLGLLQEDKLEDYCKLDY